MSYEGQPKKSGWGELGHKWITAIAALVTALTGAGFFIGRSSAPDARPVAPATVTVTAPGAAPPAGTGTTGAVPVNADPAVYWSGELEWGKFNLDLNPPNYTDGEYTQALGDLFYVDGKAQLASWKKGGSPGKADCASAVDADGFNQTRFTKDNHICGRTAEGRIFRLDVTSTGNTVRTQVIVWNK
ncbi:hypothetical protein [Amycolatopsis sp. lyj-23]|uniref:hypothetical protein n=1 Tax=Amycolatopsis sp. lyj-23 TaxID=2789283 RepID=UPI00397A8C39